MYSIVLPRACLNPLAALAALTLPFLFIACEQEAAKAPAGFAILPEFRMELLAAEPLVMDPVALQFDAAGRAWVLEMPGYPFGEEHSRLVLLEDTNGDGRYDHRQLFSDRLQLASSFLPYRDGFLVAAPPDLLFVRDTDADKVADDYQVIMSGFSTGNLQHNFNGLTYGLDNWIYAANGGNAGHPFFVADSTIRLDMRGDDIRLHVEDRRLERVGESSGGHGLAFDDWGHLYETHNTEHVSHLVFENRYLADLPVSPRHALTQISDHEENGLARIYPIGEQVTRVNHPEQSGYFSGACGITFYGGGAFPGGFNDQLFVADVVLNLVHLDVLTADGASFKASRRPEKAEFLAAADRAFRPVNMSVGPDGALYVIDMHRAVIEHPEWIPDQIEAGLDLAAGKDQGRIYRIAPRGRQLTPVTLNSEDKTALIDALGHDNQWARITAQRLLVETADKALKQPLEMKFNQTDNPLARLHLLWTLEGLGLLGDDLLLQALQAEEAGLRENAVRITEERLSKNIVWPKTLTGLLSDPDARVRMQAALVLSTMDEAQFVAQAPALQAAAQALMQRHPDSDRWTVLALAAALRRSAAPFCAALLAQREGLQAAQQQVGEILARVIGRQADEPGAAAMLDQLEKSSALDPHARATWLDALAAGWDQHRTSLNGSEVPEALEKLETKGDVILLRAAGRLRHAANLPPSARIKAMLVQAKEELLEPKLSAQERLARLQLIELEDFDRREKLLYELLDNRQPLALQQEALRQLRASNEARVGAALVERWPALGPEARKRAGDILLYKAFNHDLLLTALEDGRIKVGELNFDLERRRTLLFWSDPAIRKRAEAIFSDAGVVTRKAAIEAMQPALNLPGDVQKGKEVFTTLCSTCHRYGQEGQDVGPVLTEISRKSRETLLHEILDPNAAVDTRYLNHQVKTTEGSIFQGIVAQETDADVQLKMMGGEQRNIPKRDVAAFSSLGVSLMPEGLEAGMSLQDMADLLAFLQQPLE